MLSDSMSRRIKHQVFNRCTPKHQTYFHSFRGATSKSLQHYVEPTISEEHHDTILIHCGTNDIAPQPGISKLADKEIVEEICKVGMKCLKSKAKVVISGIIPRRNNEIDQRRMTVNNLLKKMCTEKGFAYLDNSNIQHHLLWKDGLHLTDPGISLFADNIINLLNKPDQ